MQIVRRLGLGFDDYTIDIPEDDAPAWDPATSYWIGDEVLRDHRVYVSTEDDNTGNDPILENQNATTTRWLYKQVSNAYRFLDGVLGNRTVGGSSVQIDIANAAGADAVLVFGVSAASVRVEAFDGSAASTYDTFVSMSGRTVETYYAWFTEPIGEAATKVALVDIPANAESLRLTFLGTIVEIGEILIGDVLSVGTGLLGRTSGEVKSFSRVEFNAYGELTAVAGPTRTVMDYSALVPASAFARIKDQMDRMAGSVVGAIGSPNRLSTVQMGVLGAIRWPEDLPDHYIISFRLDGVI